MCVVTMDAVVTVDVCVTGLPPNLSVLCASVFVYVYVCVGAVCVHTGRCCIRPLTRLRALSDTVPPSCMWISRTTGFPETWRWSSLWASVSVCRYAKVGCCSGGKDVLQKKKECCGGCLSGVLVSYRAHSDRRSLLRTIISRARSLLAVRRWYASISHVTGSEC